MANENLIVDVIINSPPVIDVMSDSYSDSIQTDRLNQIVDGDNGNIVENTLSISKCITELTEEIELRKQKIVGLGASLTGNETNKELDEYIKPSEIKPVLDVTLTADKALAGYKFVDNEYNVVNTTGVNNSGHQYTPSTSDQFVLPGFDDGTSVITKVDNTGVDVTPEKLDKDTKAINANLEIITGTKDESDANVTPNDMLKDTVAYNNGIKVIGTIDKEIDTIEVGMNDTLIGNKYFESLTVKGKVGKGTALVNQVSASATLDETGTLGTLVEGGSIVVTPSASQQNIFDQRTIVDSLIVTEATGTKIPDITELSKFADLISSTACKVKKYNNYIFLATGSTGTLKKINMSTGEVVATSNVVYGGVIKDFDIDTNGDVYAVGVGAKVIKRYDNNLNYVSESSVFAGDLVSITVYDMYIYISMYRSVYRVLKSDYSINITKANLVGTEIIDQLLYNNYIYVLTNNYLYQLNLECAIVAQSGSLGYVTTSSSTSWVRRHMQVLDDYIYICGRYTFKVALSGLTFMQIAVFPNNCPQMSVYENYVYGVCSYGIYVVELSTNTVKYLFVGGSAAAIFIDEETKSVYVSESGLINNYELIKGKIGNSIIGG